MKESLRFLIDEDLPHALTDVFRAAGYQAIHVREVGLRGVPDEQIAEYARSQRLCLVPADSGSPIYAFIRLRSTQEL